jgi:hypothetical protein
MINVYGKGVMRAQRIRKWRTVRRLLNENYGGDSTGWSRTSWKDGKAALVGELILGNGGVKIRHIPTALELCGKNFR